MCRLNRILLLCAITSCSLIVILTATKTVRSYFVQSLSDATRQQRRLTKFFRIVSVRRLKRRLYEVTSCKDCTTKEDFTKLLRRVFVRRLYQRRLFKASYSLPATLTATKTVESFVQSSCDVYINEDCSKLCTVFVRRLQQRGLYEVTLYSFRASYRPVRLCSKAWCIPLHLEISCATWNAKCNKIKLWKGCMKK